MEIEMKTSGDYKIIDLIGEFESMASVEKVQRQVDTAIGEKGTNLAINLTRAEYVNSGLIGLLVHWHKILEREKRKFCLIEPNPKTLEILEWVGIPRLVTIYDSEASLQRAK